MSIHEGTRTEGNSEQLVIDATATSMETIKHEQKLEEEDEETEDEIDEEVEEEEGEEEEEEEEEEVKPFVMLDPHPASLPNANGNDIFCEPSLCCKRISSNCIW